MHLSTHSDVTFLSIETSEIKEYKRRLRGVTLKRSFTTHTHITGAMNSNQEIFNKFLQDMNNSVNQITELLCVGCEYDHPSQRRHQCIMMPQTERIECYAEQAVAALPPEEIKKVLVAVTESFLLTREIGKTAAERRFPELVVEPTPQDPSSADENGISSTTDN